MGWSHREPRLSLLDNWEVTVLVSTSAGAPRTRVPVVGGARTGGSRSRAGGLPPQAVPVDPVAAAFFHQVVPAAFHARQ
jgi:hypothetical protein